MTKIIDDRQRGEERIFTVLVTALTDKGAKQKARFEVRPLIPYYDQEITNISVDRDLGLRTRYLIDVSHNEEEVEDNDSGY